MSESENKKRWEQKARSWLSDWIPYHDGIRLNDVVRRSDIDELVSMFAAEYAAGVRAEFETKTAGCASSSKKDTE